MNSWLVRWPLLLMPSVLMIALEAVPGLPVGARVLGGAAVQNWCVTHLLLVWLPDVARTRLAAWFGLAGRVQRWELYGLIVINVNAVLLPLIYASVESVIRFQAWALRRELEIERRTARSGR